MAQVNMRARMLRRTDGSNGRVRATLVTERGVGMRSIPMNMVSETQGGDDEDGGEDTDETDD